MYRINLDIRYLIEGFSVFWGMGLQSNKLKEHASLKRKVFDKSINDRCVILHWQSKKPHSERKTLVMKKLMLKTILIWRYKLSAETTLGIRYEIHTQNWRVFSFAWGMLGMGLQSNKPKEYAGLKRKVIVSNLLLTVKDLQYYLL